MLDVGRDRADLHPPFLSVLGSHVGGPLERGARPTAEVAARLLRHADHQEFDLLAYVVVYLLRTSTGDGRGAQILAYYFLQVDRQHLQREQVAFPRVKDLLDDLFQIEHAKLIILPELCQHRCGVGARVQLLRRDLFQ